MKRKTKKERRQKVISVYLQPEMDRDLREVADETMIPVSRIVARLIRDYLNARKEA